MHLVPRDQRKLVMVEKRLRMSVRQAVQRMNAKKKKTTAMTNMKKMMEMEGSGCLLVWRIGRHHLLSRT